MNNTYIDNAESIDQLPSHKMLDAIMQRYELTADQYAEQKQLGFDDGSHGRANRYKGDTTQLGQAYNAGWQAGLNEAMDDINQCET